MKQKILSLIVATILLLVVAAGGTLAYFTDSTETAVNTIVSGTLDVELEYSLDGGRTWQEVQPDSVLLANDFGTPGDMHSALIRIRNFGTLALKYELSAMGSGVVLGENAAGQPIDLRNYLSAAASTETDPSAFTSQIAAYEAGNSAEGFTAGPLGTVLSKGVLKPGESAVLSLAVWMQSTVGNEANAKPNPDPATPNPYQPYIDLGIFVVATQASVETDSIGPDYDQDATVPDATFPNPGQ